MGENIHLWILKTARCGRFNVYVQGCILNAREEAENPQPVFLTVHDVGKNHNSWINFALHPSMNNIRERAIFVHVDLLGQEDKATDLDGNLKFPSLEVIAEDLVYILNTLKIPNVIAMGDGAGANIVARFANLYSTRCLGVILVNPTATVAKLLDYFKERLLGHFPHPQHSTHDYIILHRFGYKLEDIETDEELAKAVEEYKKHIRELKLNKHNSKLYAEAFLERDDITHRISQIKSSILFAWGSRFAFAHGIVDMISLSYRAKVTYLKVDDVGDILEEAPDRLAKSLLQVSKKLGWFKNLDTAGIEPHETSTSPSQSIPKAQNKVSKEDYDAPNYGKYNFIGGYI